MPHTHSQSAPHQQHTHRVVRLTFLVVLASLSLLTASCASAPESAAIPDDTRVQPAPAGNPLENDNGEYFTKEYEWTYWRFDEITWRWSVDIPRSLHRYYSNKPRPTTRDYSVYATEELDRDIIRSLGDTLQGYAESLDLDAYETVHFIAAFVQQLAYTSDAETTGFDDYGRYPIETLVAEGGDCEDTAILLGKLMVEMGYDVVLVRLPEHMALGVLEDFKYAGTYYPYNGNKYFYLETTGLAGRIGMVPEEYEGQLAYIYDFSPRAAIDHTWTGQRGRQTYDLSIHVENQGSAPAYGCSIYAGFDAGGSKLWNTAQSQEFDLEPGQGIDLEMSLKMPDEEHTRLMVYVLRNGKSVDKSRSAWFDE